MALFDETTLRKLEQLSLVAGRVRVGQMKGERRSRKRGSSIEFAGYRNYVQGDDLRRLDWNVFARLERPFIKLFEEEEELAIHLLIDSSGSMAWPEDAGDHNKLRYALLLAGALGHMGLAAGDQVSVTLLNSKGNRRWGPHRGRQNIFNLLQFLETAAASGITDLNLTLRDYALRGRRPGLLFLVSDLLSPAGHRQGLDALLARGYEVGIIHLLSTDEVEPPLAGDFKLVDVETGEETEVTLDAPTLDLYGRRLREWQGEIAAYCRGRHIHYVPIVTDFPWDRLVMQSLREHGVVK